ncbi:outer membrane protein assembly factor BamD [Sphingobacterium sp. SRCM116780]|uniref:outer membrane protein assembly factor BamD n=1 Tax=Sphingobacterium sp. SRCM116780 TaxID=2907623 RepID=UPI001F24796D|nr:outer membrane protein assembly factor BamD [Sphingobacterium sp. SRCM116780]UIR55820.1 outer membrane protein assembly factor BamD [Sphingobacterium sp. SRCM116780]
MFLNRRIAALCAGILLLVSFSGCKSKFEKLRASNNIAQKYEEAVKLYDKKKYSKALILFEDLRSKFRGQAEAENLYYFTAFANYRLKDYTSARYHFKDFADVYPNSTRAEECRFMSAYCYYLDSPRSSLDQENTKKAIDALQLFVNLYPESERAKEAGDLIQKLRDKLEFKAFSNAKLLYDMGLNDDYRAAVIALQNVLKEYPDTKYAEEIEYLTLKSQYNFANQSVIFKQADRFNDAIDYYRSFAVNFPNSKYIKDAESVRDDAEKKMKSASAQVATINKAIAEQEKERKAQKEIKENKENTQKDESKK